MIIHVFSVCATTTADCSLACVSNVFTYYMDLRINWEAKKKKKNDKNLFSVLYRKLPIKPDPDRTIVVRSLSMPTFLCFTSLCVTVMIIITTIIIIVLLYSDGHHEIWNVLLFFARCGAPVVTAVQFCSEKNI